MRGKAVHEGLHSRKREALARATSLTLVDACRSVETNAWLALAGVTDETRTTSRKRLHESVRQLLATVKQVDKAAALGDDELDGLDVALD